MYVTTRSNPDGGPKTSMLSHASLPLELSAEEREKNNQPRSRATNRKAVIPEAFGNKNPGTPSPSPFPRRSSGDKADHLGLLIITGAQSSRGKKMTSPLLLRRSLQQSPPEDCHGAVPITWRLLCHPSPLSAGITEYCRDVAAHAELGSGDGAPRADGAGGEGINAGTGIRSSTTE